jgi:hypothetical protein
VNADIARADRVHFFAVFGTRVAQCSGGYAKGNKRSPYASVEFFYAKKVLSYPQRSLLRVRHDGHDREQIGGLSYASSGSARRGHAPFQSPSDGRSQVGLRAMFGL